MSFVAAFLAAAVLTRQFSSPRSLFYILDHPNERSLHHSATPRSGGMAFLAALLLGCYWAVQDLSHLDPILWGASGGMLLIVISAIDDVRSVSPLYRLLVHLVAAATLLLSGIGLTTIELPGLSIGLPPALGMLFTLLFVTWMINLYNFMDGMDGFAGGMAVVGFSTMALFGVSAQEYGFATANGLIAASVAGFLVWNLPPAKIFMGDTGSSVLGFFAAAMSLWGDSQGIVPVWIAWLVFSPFIVDATYTLIRRLLRGERVWESHKEHLYQRLVEGGWGQRRTLFWAYALMLACSLSGIISLQLSPLGQWLVVLCWVSIYLAVIKAVRALETGGLGKELSEKAN